MVNVSKDAYKSVEVLNGNNVVRVDEGDLISFATETGEMISGRVTKISGKAEKTKFQIAPDNSQKEEIWSVVVMAEDSLVVLEDNEVEEA